MYHLTWIVPLVLLIVYLSSPRFRGDMAESRVRRILAAGLESNRYTILNHVHLPLSGGSVLIDHVIVSRFGVFVIESLYAGGVIHGTSASDRWTLKRQFGSRRLDNPIGLNRKQQLAVQQLLGCSATSVHGLVVLVGARGFKKEVPPGVLTPEKLIRTMRKRGEPLLSPEQAASAITTIDNAQIRRPGGLLADRMTLVRLALLAVLAAGIYLAYGTKAREVISAIEQAWERRASPQEFHDDGRPKTEQELWEDALRCAWSSDTGRCACYDPQGTRVELAAGRCRELAERGSILKR